MAFKDVLERINRPETMETITKKASNAHVADPRYWTPTFAKNKDGQDESKAIVRFLPAPEGETEDFAKYFVHYITGQGNKKYFERCRTSIGQPDPAEELARKLGADDKKTYFRFGRNPRFVANILVLQDGNKPENNGKVFLFEFGNKLMKKIIAAMAGSDDPIDPRDRINVLDPINGANLKVVVRKQGGQNNYDDSSFMGPSALYSGQLDKIEEAWRTTHPLKPLVAPDTFKSYEELADLLGQVVGDEYYESLGVASSKPSFKPPVAAVETPKRAPAAPPAAPVAAQAKEEKPLPRPVAKAGPVEDDDPDKIFDDLLSGTETISADDAVEALFRD